MKATGITRKIDELGRIVLPVELRRKLNLLERDAMEIYVEGRSIILKKHEISCVFCGSSFNVTPYMEKNICPACLSYIKNM